MACQASREHCPRFDVSIWNLNASNTWRVTAMNLVFCCEMKLTGSLCEPVKLFHEFDMVSIVPSNFVSDTLNRSLYVRARSRKKLSATASPSWIEVSVSLRQ